jgi:Yip1-like protein
VASETLKVGPALSPERAWWLRVLGVLVGPRPVFFALREDDADDVSARSEPLLLVIWTAGAAAVLATPTAGSLMDNHDYDALLVAIWTFVAGGLYGAVGYFLFGFALFFGVRLLGSLGDFRRARQTVGFALVPMALSLVVLLPARLLLYGGDAFRTGGADEGTGKAVLLALQLAFALWSCGLLVLGVRVVHGWRWLRTLGAIAAAIALIAAIGVVFVVL